MDTLSPLFKTVLGIAFVTVLVGGSFYLGNNLVAEPRQAATTTASPTAIPSATSSPTPISLSVTSTPIRTTPTLGTQSSRTVTAGYPDRTRLVYGRYTITVPAGWNVEHMTDDSVPTDELKITNGGYQVRIFQGARGGVVCDYSDEAWKESPGSLVPSGQYVDLVTGDGLTIRRSYRPGGGPNDTGGGFYLCQKVSDGSYQQPTAYGDISYTNPINPKESLLHEMDTMVTSLKKL